MPRNAVVLSEVLIMHKPQVAHWRTQREPVENFSAEYKVYSTWANQLLWKEYDINVVRYVHYYYYKWHHQQESGTKSPLNLPKLNMKMMNETLSKSWIKLLEKLNQLKIPSISAIRC